MRKKILLFIALLFLSLGFLFFGLTRKADAVSSLPSSSTQASQGEVLGIKEEFTKFTGFLRDPVPSLAHWLVGRMVDGGEEFESEGLMLLAAKALITAVLGTAEETYDPNNASNPSSLPPGALLMPPGDWYFSGGAMGVTTKLIASMYQNPPASGVYYAYNLLHRLGAAPAYAANGIGFAGLEPILPIWQAFRNVAYSIFAVAMLIVGLMIMFRVKISPQTVLTVENALPRLIGVLVLITFSYAIAGFMIDLMYVVIALSIAILRSSAGGGIMSPYLVNQTAANWMATQGGFVAVFGALIGGFPFFSLLGAIIGATIFPSLATAGLGGLLFALAWILIAIFLFFKLLIALIKTYINIVLSIIFSPVLIAVGVIPGSPGGFGSWLKNLAANILVFPAVILVIIIGSAISFSVVQGGAMWYPPLMGPPDLPIFGAISGAVAGAFVKSIIGIGFLLILPNVPDIVRGAFGIKDSGIGGMIGAAFAPVKIMGGTAMSAAASYAESQGAQDAFFNKLVAKYPRAAGVVGAGAGARRTAVKETMTGFVGGMRKKLGV
ncbi:MAG: hypothetical protein ABIB61_04480 [Candidatus Shapirobacteria bacterium]